jgi:hypothetical protein
LLAGPEWLMERLGIDWRDDQAPLRKKSRAVYIVNGDSSTYDMALDCKLRLENYFPELVELLKSGGARLVLIDGPFGFQLHLDSFLDDEPKTDANRWDEVGWGGKEIAACLDAGLKAGLIHPQSIVVIYHEIPKAGEIVTATSALGYTNHQHMVIHKPTGGR